MRVLRECLARFSTRLVLILSVMLLGSFAMMGLFVRPYMRINFREYVIFFKQNPWLILCMLIFILFMIWLDKLLLKISEWLIFMIGSASYVLGISYIMVNSEHILRADPNHVWKAALGFNVGHYHSLVHVGSYLYKNPHQLGLMTLDRIWAVLGHNQVGFLFVVYTFITLAIIFMQWRLVDKIWENIRVNKYTLILSFIFLPSFFFILWIYGSQPGLLFILFSLYSFLLYDRDDKPVYGLLGGLFSCGCSLLT